MSNLSLGFAFTKAWWWFPKLTGLRSNSVVEGHHGSSPELGLVPGTSQLEHSWPGALWASVLSCLVRRDARPACLTRALVEELPLPSYPHPHGKRLVRMRLAWATLSGSLCWAWPCRGWCLALISFPALLPRETELASHLHPAPSPKHSSGYTPGSGPGSTQSDRINSITSQWQYS